jgi:hypothetical protein
MVPILCWVSTVLSFLPELLNLVDLLESNTERET